MIIFITALFGIAVGSFLNVVILRGEKGESIGGRSRCPECKKTLTAGELIPLLSFILQKGRCVNCKANLTWQYPLVEAGTAVLFASTAFFIAQNQPLLDFWSFAYLIFTCIAVSAGIVVLVSDLRTFIIPDGAVITLLGTAVAIILLNLFVKDTLSYSELGKNILSSIILSGFLASLWLFSRGTWMGLGDAKLFLPLALLLGFPASLAAFLFSFWIGSLGAIALLVLKNFGLRDQIPFGPFILIGAVLAIFYANTFLQLSGLHNLF